MYRAGSAPMTTNGQTDLSAKKLVQTDRGGRRPDGDGRRNQLTSIYWMPTKASPLLNLTVNLSDHIHYHHGGAPFEYKLVNPETGEVTTHVLGPDLLRGQRPQVVCQGGWFKCGRLLCGGDPNGGGGGGGADYCLLGEAVAPGFDFHDFSWVTQAVLEATCTEEQAAVVRPYLHQDADELAEQAVCMADTTSYYQDEEKRKAKAEERMPSKKTKSG